MRKATMIFQTLLSVLVITTGYLVRSEMTTVNKNQIPHHKQRTLSSSIDSVQWSTNVENKINLLQQTVAQLVHKLDQQNTLLEQLNAKIDQQSQPTNQSPLQTSQATDQLSQSQDQRQEQSQNDNKLLHEAAAQSLRPSLTRIIPGNADIETLTSFNNQLFVKRANRNQIEVYNTLTFDLVRNITLPAGLLRWPWGIAHCRNEDCLYVSDMFSHKVHKVSLEIPTCSNTVTTTTWTVASRPTGLSVNKLNNVLVAHADSKKIQEYTPDGTLVREISDSNWLWHAVERTDGMLAVSRVGPVHGVCLMSADGRVLRSYGESFPGAGPGQMNDPRILAVNKDGFVIVADDGNNRILVLNPTLTEARPLLTDITMNKPRGLSLDESVGRLYVGEYGSPSRVLVIDNVFDLGATLFQ